VSIVEETGANVDLIMSEIEPKGTGIGCSGTIERKHNERAKIV